MSSVDSFNDADNSGCGNGNVDEFKNPNQSITSTLGEHEVSDREAEVSAGAAEVSTKEDEVSDGEAEVSDGAAEVPDGEDKVSAGAAEVSAGEDEVPDGEAEVSAGAARVSAKEAEVTARRASKTWWKSIKIGNFDKLKDLKRPVTSSAGEDEASDGEAEVSAGEAKVSAGEDEVTELASSELSSSHSLSSLAFICLYLAIKGENTKLASLEDIFWESPKGKRWNWSR